MEIFVFAVVANRIGKYFGIKKWILSLGLIVLAVFFYLLSNLLIRYFIKKRAPEFWSSEEEFGEKKWEQTADLGIVPKWVSIMGLLSFSAVITAIFPWVIELIKNLF